MPRFGRRGQGGGLRGIRTETVLLALFGLFVAIIGYSQFVLPELESLRCGPDYAEQLAIWEEVGSVGEAPQCRSELPEVLQNLHQVLPLIFVAPLVIMAFKQVAAPAIAPVMIMCWLITWLVPSPLVDLSVLLLGLAACCVPHVVRGPLAAFSHAVALFLWPAFSLFVVETAAGHDLPVGLPWALDFGVFLILPAVLISIPIIGWVRGR